MANADYKYILFAEDGKHELSITEKTEAVPRKHLGNVYKILDEELAPVAFDNDYDSLYNKPSIPSFTSSQLNYLKNTLPAAITFDRYGQPFLASDKRLGFNLKDSKDSPDIFFLQSKQALIYPHIKNGTPVFGFYANETDSAKDYWAFLDILCDRGSAGVTFKSEKNASLMLSYHTGDTITNASILEKAVNIIDSNTSRGVHEKIFTFCCKPEYEGTDSKVVKFISGNVECESVILKSSTPATYGAQIAFDDNKSGLVKVRGKAGDWGPWFTLLHSGNYTDYTVTKTGSGASGTWGISITGNAASATKLATARTISLTGSVTGSGTFDGSGNLSIATTTNHTHNYAGSSSAGGSANSAVKLDTATAGDSNTPVYFSGGKPVACTSLDLNTSGNAATASKVNNKLTVGSKSYDGSAAVTIEASDLGLASAMLFLGTTTTAITDGSTTNPVAISGSNKTVTAGNVVLYGSKEFVWTGRAWEELGNEGSYKIVQAAVADPSASGTSNTFIATISQDTNGKITATKKTVAVTNSAPTLAWGTTSTIGTVAGTNLQVKMPANPNTDTKVTQTAINAADYTNWRPLIWGSSNSGTEGFTPSTVTDGVYTAQTLSCQPSTGTIRATTFKGSLSGNADTATKLATARTIRTNLASTSAASFDGSANITPGVTGTLPIANGGTGATTASAARNNLGAQSKVLYGSSAPSDSTGSNGDMYIALESGDFKKDIVDLIYPVGSIYISMNSTNPSTLFGGTWEAFGQGRVLIGAGTGNDGSTSLSFTAGGTGGEYKHTLSVSEMPSHTHTQNSHTHSVGAHSHGLNSHTHSYTKATGVAGHTLTTAEMPSHYHTFGTADRQNNIVTGWADYGLTMRTGSSYDIAKETSSAGGGGSHNHGLNTSSANTGAASGSTANSSAFNSGSTTATNKNTGGGSSHNNIQPYIVVYMWKRTA